MKTRLHIFFALAALSVLVFLVLLASAHRQLGAPVDLAATAEVGSAACADCHSDRHDSWHRTFHRTMTQAASADSVVGRFDGAPLEAFGGIVEPVIENGRHLFRYRDPETRAVLAELPIERTVGSHRYQQYLMRAEDSGNWYRLHYLWHIEEQRWVHMNAAFLGDDGQVFDAQVATWNNNCVYCHNTGPRPRVRNLAELRERARAGIAVDAQRELEFDTTVAELGIGCEACHGPGRAHVERMGKPLLRLYAKFRPGLDRSTVNPDRLPAARVNDLCGACHAGRTQHSVEALDRWLDEGPSFRPGEVLSEHVRILGADTPSPSPRVPDLYRNRFWPDGSVRLSAYEYQALAASTCAQAAELSCIDCHTMHGGDPAGMLPEANRGDTPCLRCHQDFRTRVVEHSGHPAESSGARCMNCHMPSAVYGVMTIHRTHQIAVPDVAADLAAGKPNACLNCHAETAPATLAKAGADPLHRHDGAPAALADGLAALLAGDPVRQAVAAYELGRTANATGPDALRVRIPWLIAALGDDRPAIRRFAWRSLRQIDMALAATSHPTGLASSLARFDYTGPPSERQAAVAAITQAYAALDKAQWPAPPPEAALDAAYRLDPGVRAGLEALGRRSDKQIDIGE